MRSWLLALVPGVALLALAPWSALDRTVATFLLVEVVAFGLLCAEESRGSAALEEMTSPG